MYRQCVFPLLALYVGLAQSFSWNIVVARAISPGSCRLEFYNDGELTESVEPANDLEVEWLSHDPIHKRVLLFDKTSLTDSVLSFDLSTSEIQTLIKKKHIQDISTIAYDPKTELFFGIINKIIYSFLVKPGNDNDIDKKLVINLQKDDSVEPRDIVVDSSCGGYIYWTTFSNTNKIERVRFNGFDREVILDSSDMTREALAIDSQTKKMFWIECQKDVRFSILSADLKGKNIRALYSKDTTQIFTPFRLTVSKDFIYWGNRIEPFFWQLPSNPLSGTTVEPNQVSMDSKKFGFGFLGIATNYEIEEHAQEISNCKATDSDPINVSTDVRLRFLHDIEVSSKSRVKCKPGYTGNRCDVSVCQNYCIHGDCKVSTEGQPKCSCNAGYSGAKCEVKACQGHCLNNGVCSLDEDSKPVCQCTSHYEGDTCNVPIFLSQCPPKLNTEYIKPVTLEKGVKSTRASQLPRMTVTWKTALL